MTKYFSFLYPHILLCDNVQRPSSSLALLCHELLIVLVAEAAVVITVTVVAAKAVAAAMWGNHTANNNAWHDFFVSNALFSPAQLIFVFFFNKCFCLFFLDPSFQMKIGYRWMGVVIEFLGFSTSLLYFFKEDDAFQEREESGKHHIMSKVVWGVLLF